MKKITLGIMTSLTLLSSSSLAADEYNGFSYIGFGVETATYQETGTIDGINFKSSSTVSSPVYTSGSLINMGSSFDFSIDAASTLSATSSDEKVQDTDKGVIIYTQQFDSMISDLKFLLQYKINNNHRLVIGPNYNLFSMKRYDPTNRDGEPVTKNGNPVGLNQEDIATLNMMVGYAYESAPFSNGGMRVSTNILYGKPVWNKATNTSLAEEQVSSTEGSTINANAYIGFEMTKGLEMGMFVGYTLKRKDGADPLKTSNGVWPENELETVRYGVSFVWNFDVK